LPCATFFRSAADSLSASGKSPCQYLAPQPHHIPGHGAEQRRPHFVGEFAADKGLADDLRVADAGQRRAIGKAGDKDDRKAQAKALAPG
jgi:hypothetical protein